MKLGSNQSHSVVDMYDQIHITIDIVNQSCNLVFVYEIRSGNIFALAPHQLHPNNI